MRNSSQTVDDNRAASRIGRAATREEITIAGAGLSGLSCAINLARRGFHVRVFDTPGFYRQHPICLKALRNKAESDALDELAKYGVNIRPLARVDDSVRVSGAYMAILKARSYYIIESGSSDASLERQMMKEAFSLGVAITETRDPVVASARVVATGVPRKRANIRSVGYTFRLGSGLNQETKAAVTVLYDNAITVHGYACAISCPESGLSTVMAVSFGSDSQDRLKAGLDNRIASDGLLSTVCCGNGEAMPFRGRGFVCRDPIVHAEKLGQLFVGEAAGFQDALRGFGVRYAIITGSLAACSIAEKADYRTLLRECFREEFALQWDQRSSAHAYSDSEYEDMVRKIDGAVRLKPHVLGKGANVRLGRQRQVRLP